LPIDNPHLSPISRWSAIRWWRKTPERALEYSREEAMRRA
jgi:hypothetical protein